MNDIIIVILGLHFISDFILQSDWIAKNKSKSNKALLIHTSVYSLPFLAVFGWKYALVNMTLHTAIDFVTSRISSKLYAKGKIHEFFVVIGFDQYLHAICLISTIGMIK